MAGAMHKMAVYLGLVEDDPRYDDGYDSYEEYDEYGEPLEHEEPEPERPAVRASRVEFAAEPPPAASRTATRPRLPPMRPIWRASPRCTRARTMKPVPSESISVRALR